MPTSPRILVTGALGQIGSELVETLRARTPGTYVLASDIREPEQLDGPFAVLDVTDRQGLMDLVQKHQINQIYHLAAILSAKGEQNPTMAWDINMKGLLNVLEVARETGLERLFWPSSIAVFGPSTPQHQTPQETVMAPNTVYGISKLAGERWCEYYHQKYGLDVRSIRYPGLIGYKSLPGGGTTDYAVDIFHAALREGVYSAFLKEDCALPMMFMPDAIRATIELMEAEPAHIQVRSAYNLGGISFTPAELTVAIQVHLPEFVCTFEPDFRQEIADSWPASIDDSAAQKDWNWKQEYDLNSMTKVMLEEVRQRYVVPVGKS